jgi:hypothetical protein
MSVLKVNQIKAKLRSMFEHHLDLTDISPADAERETKILTRALAALAVYSQSGCTEKDASQAVWDGSGDNGIDAAYYDHTESRVLFVQSKWIMKGAGEPEAKDVLAFLRGVREAVEQDKTNFDPRLQGRLSDILLRLTSPGTSVHLVVVSTGASQLATPARSSIDNFLNELNGDDPNAIATGEVMGLTEVYTTLANDPQRGSPTLEANILDWTYIAAPFPAYCGTIDGLQLKEWWTKHGKRVVAANIRHSLGATDVNTQIRQTASSTPEKFWYFNNGITLVAEDVAKAPAGAASHAAGLFRFNAASIVNGAQTVSSLSRVADDTNLGKVRVSIRVVLLNGAPDGFGEDVARTNNLQNRIETRDFVSQDPEQKRIREEMAIEGVDYQFVRSEESNVGATSCELVEVTTALACASADSGLAVQIKTGIGRFFVDLGKPPYKTLFNPSTSGAKAFNATVMNRAIENWIERRKRGLAKKSGPQWGVLVHGNRALAAAVFRRSGPTVLTKTIASFADWLKQVEIDTVCEKVYLRMVEDIQLHYSNKFLASLFKNPTMTKSVFEYSIQ